MGRLMEAPRRPWWRRIQWQQISAFWPQIQILVAVIASVASILGAIIGGWRIYRIALEGMTPPILPTGSGQETQIWSGTQGWVAEQAEQFHFESLGTHTLPIPRSWFLALEQPLDSPLTLPFREKGRFADASYLQRFGFLSAKADEFNPDGLPIGFTVTHYQTIAGLQRKDTAIGFTCSACHTGSVVYQGKRYIVDGGSAAINFEQFNRALDAALEQTFRSEKLSPFDGRFERFSKAVLGVDAVSETRRSQLTADLQSVLDQIRSRPDRVAVSEGFGRLDWLNRIGNEVFALGPHRSGNYADLNAPVKFPHIWTSSWFTWTLYDGSMMKPLARDSSEVWGAGTQIIYDTPPDAGRFQSSIAFDNLHWIEQTLAGPEEPLKKKAFSGLNAPVWPEAFPAIDQAKAADGAQLYDKLCKGCHLPALTHDVAYGKAPNSPFWSHFGPILFKEKKDGKEVRTNESVLGVHIIPQTEIGTDPAQGEVMTQRLINTAGSNLQKAGDFTPGMGLNIDICVGGEAVHVSDNGIQSYATALGGLVQQGIEEWFKVTREDSKEMQGDRPNCLQAGRGYKARPLNGVWAVAPYLHNGSVPTIYDLLSPVSERPKAFLLGSSNFDPVRVGVAPHAALSPGSRTYNDRGYFILDTSISGNHNTGHEFSDDKHEGVIGPALSSDERMAIIEFLKTL